MNTPAFDKDPVTVVVRRTPLHGREDEFEWGLRDLVSRLSAAPGHRGTGILRPPPGHREYTVVARFDDADCAAAWEHAPQRAEWLDLVAPFTDGHPPLEQQPGLEFWFTPPGSPTLRQPRRWKMVLLTLGTLYPVSLLFNLLIGPVLAHWPLWLRTLLSAAIVVSTMTLLLMPLVTRLFQPWLSAEARERS